MRIGRCTVFTAIMGLCLGSGTQFAQSKQESGGAGAQQGAGK